MNAASPSTEPTERSTLRVMITSVWPAARIAKIAAFSARLRSESALTKRGSMTAVKTMSATNAPTMPSSRTRKTHSVRRRASPPVAVGSAVVASTALIARASVRGCRRRRSSNDAMSRRRLQLSGRRVHDPLLRRVGPRELARQPALVHDEHAIGHPEDLGQLARDHQHRDPAPGELGEQPVDLGLRADVDAARRLVDDEDLRLGREPLRQHDLLLVAAREEPDRVVELVELQLQPLRPVVR